MEADWGGGLCAQWLINDWRSKLTTAMYPSHSEEADVKTEAVSSGIPFEEALLKAVDESLLMLLGESGAAAIYFHMEGISSLKRSEIPRRLKEFSLATATIFRAGAPVLEQSILRTLCEKLGMDYESVKAVEFQTALETVRQRLPMHM